MIKMVDILNISNSVTIFVFHLMNIKVFFCFFSDTKMRYLKIIFGKKFFTTVFLKTYSTHFHSTPIFHAES